MMLLPLLVSLAAFAAPPPAALPEDCQLNPAAVPAFTLIDENPNSASYGQKVSTSELIGPVLVMYWAQAS